LPLSPIPRRRSDPAAIRSAVATRRLARELLVLAAIVCVAFLFRDAVLGRAVDAYAVVERGGALVVPADALFEATSATPWVLVVVDGHASQRRVKIGRAEDGRVEIVDGIKAGDRLIPSGAGIAPGERVRVDAARAP